MGGCDPPAHTAVGWLGVGVELGPCGVMGLRESSHGAGRVGPKGALLQMLPWPRAKLLASPLLHGSKPCLTSCQGEERRVTEEVQPPPGSQDWDVLLTHRAGLWGPLREGSRQPPSLQVRIKAAVAHTGHQEALQSQLPSSGPGARPQGPRPADVSPTFLKDPGPLPGRVGQTSGDAVLLRVCQYPSPPRDTAVGEAGPCPWQSSFLLWF